MNLRWTQHALEQLQAIHAHISQDSPAYADAIVDRITKRSQQLEVFPGSGRAVPEYLREDIRELIEGPFRLIYRLIEEDEVVDILAVLHGARLLTDDDVPK